MLFAVHGNRAGGAQLLARVAILFVHDNDKASRQQQTREIIRNRRHMDDGILAYIAPLFFLYNAHGCATQPPPPNVKHLR